MTETVRTKRWTRLEYERLIDLAVFGPGERLELLGGQLLVREPQGRPHATGIRLVARALRAVFGSGWSIEAQLPVALDEESEPEPDIAVPARIARVAISCSSPNAVNPQHDQRQPRRGGRSRESASSEKRRLSCRGTSCRPECK